MKVYLAGPMSNVPYLNFPLFQRVTAELRSLGYEVFSPVEQDFAHYGVDVSAGNPTGSVDISEREYGLDRRKQLTADLKWIGAEGEGICMLPGWEQSTGATAELALAIALDLVVMTWVESDRPHVHVWTAKDCLLALGTLRRSGGTKEVRAQVWQLVEEQQCV